MKRERLTKWEKAAIDDHLRWHPSVEVIHLNKRLTAVKIAGNWVVNEEVDYNGKEKSLNSNVDAV